MKRGMQMSFMPLLLVMSMILSACAPQAIAASEPAYTSTPPQSFSAPTQEQPSVHTHWITEQILSGEDGEIYFPAVFPVH